MAKNTTRHGVPDPGPEPGDYEGATWDGKHWIREGQVVKAGPWDNTSVQELLGHSRPETTARYTLVDEDELTAAVLSVA